MKRRDENDRKSSLYLRIAIRPLVLLFSFFIFNSYFAFAVPLDSLVSTEHTELLKKSGKAIIKTQLKNPSPVLLPDNAELRLHFLQTLEALKPGMMVEAMFLYQKPEHAQSAASGSDIAFNIELFNQLTALSTLTGIEYYSESRGRMRTFFEYSGVIDAPNTKKPLPDPVYSTLPPELTLYVRQKDLTFGDNIYLYKFITGENSIFFIQENVTSLNVSIIPAIGKGNLRSILAVFDCGDTLLIYAVSMAKAVSVPGIGERIGNSFTNRAEAIIKWFLAGVDKLYETGISFDM